MDHDQRPIRKIVRERSKKAWTDQSILEGFLTSRNLDIHVNVPVHMNDLLSMLYQLEPAYTILLDSATNDSVVCSTDPLCSANGPV